MATLPAPGYLSAAARTVLQEQTAVEAQRDVIAQLPGGSAEATLTIASGSVTPGSEDSGRAKSTYAIDTEAAAAADDLTNVVQTNLPDGSLLLIRGANASHVVTAKHSAGGAGQLSLIGAVDRVLGTTTWLLLKRTGAVWDEILTHGPAGGDLTGTYPNPTIAALAVTDGKVAAANKDGAAGTVSLRTLGTGAAQACAGNDVRLSDARMPTAHKDAHKSGGSDALLSTDLIEAIVKRLQESGGPTTLTLGAIADGEFIKRSGTSFIGAAISGLLDQITGLKLSNNGADPGNRIDIAAGAAVSQDAIIADRVLISLASVLTKRLDAAWAVGSGNGGLDTGSLANDTYDVWLMRRSDTGVVDACFSLSALGNPQPDSPPAGYDKFRRLGSILVEGSAIVYFVQDADYFRRKASKLDLNVTDPGTSAVTRTLSTPKRYNMHAVVTVLCYNPVSSGSKPHVYLSDLDVNDEAPSATAAPLGQTSGIGTTFSAVPAEITVRTNTAAQIRSRVDESSANIVLRIATLGWWDRRGRG